MIVTAQTAPSTAQLLQVASSAATAMDVDVTRVLVSVVPAGLGNFPIVFNVTSAEDPEAEPTTPVLAITNLFGDNTRFAAFIDSAIASGLKPSSTEPMPSGLEIEGSIISGTTPRAPTSPAAPSSPSSAPTTPSSSPTPVAAPESAPSPLSPLEPSTPGAPRSANVPSGAAADVLRGVTYMFFMALLVSVMISFWA